MAVLRDRPYVQFNFLVDLGTGDTDGPEAGFQECSASAWRSTVAEYRNGNEKENSVRKITGLNKATDVTLKRGVIGSLNLYQWLDQIRNGDQEALRTVTDPAPERGPHRGRADLEAAARADHQARQRPVQRQGHRRRDGGAHARLRAARDGVSEPFTALHFRVEIMLPGAAEPLCEAAFAECDGLELRFDVITYSEGGERGPRLIPGPASTGRVTLRRGMTSSPTCGIGASRSSATLRADVRVVILAPDGTEQAAFRCAAACRCGSGPPGWTPCTAAWPSRS